MKKLLVYLDNCCFNRPYDDQMQLLIKLETEAKLLIQMEILVGSIDLVWSFILHQENADNPFEYKRRQIALWEEKAAIAITLTSQIKSQAADIMKLGIKNKDALHLACAISANADYFITTDKRLLVKTVPGVNIVNPIDFFRR